MDKPLSRMNASLEKTACEMQALWGENAERVALQRAAWADQLELAQSAQIWRAVAAAVHELTVRNRTA